MSVTVPEPRGTARPRPQNRTHYLYVAVVAAVGLGILVGLLFPDFAVELKPLGTAFVALIKMMIQPVIFCTIVIGVGSVRSAARVGKVGGLALAYFLAMSTVALAIGLLVGNVLHPGSGLHLTDEAASAGAAQAEGADDEDHHDQHLQDQDLARDRRLPSAATPAHAGIVPHGCGYGRRRPQRPQQ